MKKFHLVLVVVLLTTFLSSCTAKEYENFQELNSSSKLIQGNVVYSFYSALPKELVKGKQIGIVDGDKKHKVFEVKGYLSDEWIIEYYDVVMSTYSLFKADTVSDIPDEFN